MLNAFLYAQIKGRSREWVWYLIAWSLRRDRSRLELNIRDKMKEPPFLTVPTFVACNRYIFFLADQGVKMQVGLGNRSAIFTAWSGSGDWARTSVNYHLILGSPYLGLHLLNFKS